MNKAYFPQIFCCYALTSPRRSLPNSPQDDRKALDSGDQPAGTTALESRADSRKASSGGRGLGKREVDIQLHLGGSGSWRDFVPVFAQAREEAEPSRQKWCGTRCYSKEGGHNDRERLRKSVKYEDL